MGKQFEGADRTARFWTHVNGGWVKLSVRWDRDLRVCYGGPCDEGYSYSQTTWKHTGDGVREEWQDWGRDCDGRHESGGERFAPLDQLADITTDDVTGGPRIPNWTLADRHQRDYTAEAAGY